MIAPPYNIDATRDELIRLGYLRNNEFVYPEYSQMRELRERVPNKAIHVSQRYD